MLKTILNSVGAIFGPVRELIDEVHTSAEERAAAQARLNQIEYAARADLLSHAEKIASLQSQIVLGEIQGRSWLQRNWRPLLMLTVVLILFNNFVLAPYFQAFGAPGVYLDLPTELYGLMTVGVGGYIGGRTYEKKINTDAKIKQLQMGNGSIPEGID